MMTLFFVFLLTAQIPTTPFYGVATASDGDSLTVAGRRVRLFGIDAPEFDQTCTRGGQQWACGAAATEHLANLVTGREVRCIATGVDRYDRILARCTVGTTDINRTIVASGHAIAFRRYSADYVSAEDSAKANRRGIWAGTFQMPQAYRGETDPLPSARSQTERAVASGVRPSSPTSGCNIKGNRSRRGDWIYHLPGMPYYAGTRAEDLFCSEVEARAAGYRRARLH